MSTLTITEFLEARIAGDEAEVQAALLLRGSGTHWRIGHPLDPARLLAECAAKRAIIALHRPYDVYDRNPLGYCKECCDSGWDAALDGAGPVHFPCPTIKAILPVYADHPDYDQGWAQ